MLFFCGNKNQFQIFECIIEFFEKHKNLNTKQRKCKTKAFVLIHLLKSEKGSIAHIEKS